MLEISINDGDDVELCAGDCVCHAVLFRLSYMYGGNLNDVELYKGACIITKIAYVMQCSLGLALHIPYGGNLNDGNDVELCEGACIYNKDCVCYAVLLELLCIITRILFLLS